MSAVTLAYLIIGGLGLLVLVVALLGGELLHIDGGGGFWSTEAFAGFAGAFGFVAAAVHELAGGTAALVLAPTVGVLAAIPTAYLAIRLSKAARDMRTDATPTRGDLVGTLGVVVTPIPAHGYGEVRVRLGGQPVKLSAQADRPIPTGAHVFVIEAPSDTSVVVEQTDLPQN